MTFLAAAPRPFSDRSRHVLLQCAKPHYMAFYIFSARDHIIAAD
jgi:hypothetical protein